MLYKSPFNIPDSKDNFKKIKDSKGVIVFGTGNLGNIVIAALKKIGVNIVCLTDNNRSRWGKIYNGHKVISPKELVNTNNKTPILVASDLTFPYIHRQLKERGFDNLITRTHKALDLTNQSAVDVFFESQEIDYVILLWYLEKYVFAPYIY